MYYSKIIVQHKDGSKASGARVSIGFSSGGFSKDFYTDSKGIAVVEHASRGSATVYVRGIKQGSFSAPGEFVAFI